MRIPVILAILLLVLALGYWYYSKKMGKYETTHQEIERQREEAGRRTYEQYIFQHGK